MEKYWGLIAVWLVAGAMLVFYVRQLGVSMKTRKTKVDINNTPDGKLQRAADSLVKARALLTTAKQLAEEAGVPLLGDLIGHADTLTDQAAKLADAVRFNGGLQEGQEALATTRSQPVASDDRATLKSPYSREIPDA